MTAAGLEPRLRRVLDERYHHLHPFHRRMHDGALSREEIRTWVRNRYYYQTRIPIKDGLILAKAEQPAFRRSWIQRIHDHDGEPGRSGGLELWLELARAVGLDPAQVASLRDVLPGVRRACDDYVDFVAGHDLLESVAASLTELRAGPLMAERRAAFARHYPWIAREGLRYFETRSDQAPRDAEQGLGYVLEHAREPEAADRCVAALERKCEILWRLLDAVEWASARLRLARAALRRDVPEPLVVLPERAVEPNASGREILDLCDGSRCVGELAAELRRRHPEAEGVERDAYAFLEQMQQLGVLEASP